VLLSRPFKKLEIKTETLIPWSRDQDQDLGSLVSRPRPTKSFAQNSTIKFHFKNKCIHTHSSTFCCTLQCTSNSLQYYTNVHFHLHANDCHCPTFTSRYSFYISLLQMLVALGKDQVWEDFRCTIALDILLPRLSWKLETKFKTFTVITWDQDQDHGPLVSRPRPRPWHPGLKTKTETFEKWTRVHSSHETLVSRSHHW